MNKKISQFELTTKLQEQDLITLVQDGSNKNITSDVNKVSKNKRIAI